MNARVRKNLEVWISQRIHEEQLDSAPLRFFKVGQVIEGQPKKSNVLEVPYRDQGSGREIAEQILSHTQEDANAIGGTVKYEIKAMYGLNEAESRGGRFALRLTGEGDDREDENGFGSVSPTALGMLSQQMRHNEGFARTLMVMLETVTESNRSTISQLTGRLRDAEDRVGIMSELLERYSSDRVARDIELRREMASEKMRDRALDLAQEIIVPRIIQKFGAPTTRIEAFLSTLSEDQLMQFVGTLSETQKEQLLPIYTEMKMKAEARDTAKAKADEERERILKQAETAPEGKPIDVRVKEERDKEAGEPQ